MGIYDDYKPEYRVRLNGTYRVEIVGVEESVSKTSNNPMIIITIRPNGHDTKIKHYIVKNEYFNRNITDIFESFNIEYGNFLLPSWVGSIGAAKISPDEQGYSKIKYFLDQEQQEKLPPWEGPVPERQTVTQIEDAAKGYVPVDDEDELPF